MNSIESTSSAAPKTSPKNSLRGVYVSTYGCQMNVNDSERMYSILEMANYTPVASPEQADLIIINSCSVREKPVHKVFSEVGRYRRLKDRNPQLRIGVGGCVGQMERSNLLTDAPLIDFVFGPDNIDELPRMVHQIEEKARKLMGARFEHAQPYHIETMVRNPGVATFVNITKGCDNFCTFCVVPFTRGRERSRPFSHLLDDINKLIDRGVKEVTLLGQNVNSYESDCGADFADLLAGLAQKTKIERIRFTTSHPKDFDEKLIQVMAEHQEKICEYIHLPVQSGNDAVLARMNRGYTRQEYLTKIDLIRKHMPDVVLSTDIIVGFPGETEEQFQDTLSLVLDVGYETMYSFKYSPRPLTKAAKFSDQVPEDDKSRRLERLQNEHREMADRMVQKYLGLSLPVLVEEYSVDQNMFFGRSRQNKTVHFVASNLSFEPQVLIGQTVPVKVEHVFPATFRGQMVRESVKQTVM